MRCITNRHARLGRGAATAILATVAAPVWALLGPGTASAAAAMDPAKQCLPSSGAVTAHFILGSSGSPDPGVAGVTLDGFDPGSCDGQPVTVTLSGNQAGDPNAPVTELLSTLASTRDACSGAKRQDPELIDGGSITLTGCATTSDGKGTAYADVHDLTLLTVKVSGHKVPSRPGGVVLGDQATRPRGDGGAQVLGEQVTRPRDSGTGILAFTGGPRPFALWVGILLLVFGVASILLDQLAGSRAQLATLVKTVRERREARRTQA